MNSRTFLPLLLGMLLIPVLAKPQSVVALKAGPNYTFYFPSETDTRAELNPGWGTDAGLVILYGDDHRVSFRSEVLYSLQVTNAVFTYPVYPHEFMVDGRFYRHNLLLSVQCQFNLLKNKNLYIALGPFYQYALAMSGHGTYSDMFYPSPFTGNDPINSHDYFMPWNAGATLGFGICKIRVGGISLFGEIRETVGFSQVVKNDAADADWGGTTTTVAVGIEFRKKK